MKGLKARHYRPALASTLWVVALLFVALACGPGEEATPTPTAAAIPTATPTTTTAPTAQPLATPTPTATPAPVASPVKQPKRGGTFRFATIADTPNFDPQLLAVLPDFFVTNSKLYSNLLLNYVEEIAECELCSEWHLENSSKTMVFNLIPGVKFHTGQELTSADVKYSLRMIMGEVDGIASTRSGVFREYVDSIEAPSRYQVRINLLRPSAFVPKVLANASSVMFREGTTRTDLKQAPAGSGPFKVNKIVPGASWALDRNPDYFKPGQPYLERVEITVIADTNTRVASFLTGRSDMWQWPSYPPEQYLPKFYQLRDEGKINSEEFLGGTGLTGTIMVNSKPPFNNLKLRQALNLAMDRKKMGLVSYGKQLQHPHLMVYTETSYWSTRTDKEIWDVVPGWGTGAKKDQEIEQSKQLLKDAGYPAGLDIEQMSGGGDVEQELQRELAQVGIRTKFLTVDATGRAQRLANHDFTIFQYLLRMTTRDPDEVVGQNFVTGATRNVHDYSNPQVDKLYVQMSSELDPAKRKQILGQIVDIVMVQDVAFAPTVITDTALFWWKRLQGITIGQTLHSPPGLLRSDRLWFEE